LLYLTGENQTLRIQAELKQLKAKDISILSLWSGVSIQIFLLTLLLVHEGTFLLATAYLAPGLIYGFVLAAHDNNRHSDVRDLTFIFLSLVINALCVHEVNLLNDERSAAFNLILCGGAGAALLKTCYDLVLHRRFSFLYTVVLPYIFGVLSTLIPSACMYLAPAESNSAFVSGLCWVGILSVYPIWQYLFALNIKMHNNASIRRLQPQKKHN
jgi:hypothetical protein